MKLKQKINQLRLERSNLLKKLDFLNKEISKYKNSTHITTPLLVKELSEIVALKKCKTKGISIDVFNGEYQYILGGDGRSEPWAEMRKGIICNIKTIYYLTEIQQNLVKNYLESIGKADQINFK